MAGLSDRKDIQHVKKHSANLQRFLSKNGGRERPEEGIS